MNQLTLLNQLSSIAALLALPSLSTVAPEHEYEGCTVTSSPESPHVRKLYFEHLGDEPLIEATNRPDYSIDLRAHDTQLMPHDFALALTALGFKQSAGWAGTMDADEFDRRASALDSAFCMLHRMRKFGVSPDDTVPLTCKLLLLASAYREVRQVIFDGSQRDGGVSAAIARREQSIIRDCEALVAGGQIPGLQRITLHDEPRGSALSIQMIGERDPFEVIGLSIDWHCEIARPSLAPIGSGKFAVRPSRIPEVVMGALQSADFIGEKCRLTVQLPKKAFAAVNDLFNELGGTWCTGAQAHVFTRNAKDVLKDVLASGEVFTRKDFEFFWTPSQLVARMLRRANLRPGMKVLEPNGGNGAIALAAAEVVGIENVACYELMPENVECLRSHGFSITGSTDFLSVEPEPVYEGVLLNPPFSAGRDVAHVTHAFKFVKPGGVLVAITSPTWKTRSDRASKAFASLLASLRAEVEPIEPGAFREAGTDVGALLITLRKPMQSQCLAQASNSQREMPTRVLAPNLQEEQLALF